MAVDPETGEVGSAGGSCIAGSIIISDLHISQGVIHTQSYYHPTNQNNASNYMNQGYSPQEIIDYLINNDVSNNPGIRQYGIVDLENNGLLLFNICDASKSCAIGCSRISRPSVA